MAEAFSVRERIEAAAVVAVLGGGVGSVEKNAENLLPLLRV
jgi:hypothetical protein